jgi:hypothetical protein
MTEQAACHEFTELLARWRDRDVDVDSFELHARLLSLCETFGWDVPADLR